MRRQGQTEGWRRGGEALRVAVDCAAGELDGDIAAGRGTGESWVSGAAGADQGRESFAC
jgi:hypothetical protein